MEGTSRLCGCCFGRVNMLITLHLVDVDAVVVLTLIGSKRVANLVLGVIQALLVRVFLVRALFHVDVVLVLEVSVVALLPCEMQ
eukprot:6472069-Amphidinium_carterae.1